MKDMHVFERDVNGRRYRIAAQSVWDPVRGRSVARQIVLGPATAAPVADLSATRTVGTQAVGDVGALIWIAEQLDLIGHIDRACGSLGAKGGPSVGELAVAVAIQRACLPGPKRDLAEFLDGAVRGGEKRHHFRRDGAEPVKPAGRPIGGDRYGLYIGF